MRISNFFLTLFLAFSTFCFSSVSKLEKEVLISFYNSTNGTEWNQTWDLSEPVENWYGVTVIDNSVVELDLSFNNLSC